MANLHLCTMEDWMSLPRLTVPQVLTFCVRPGSWTQDRVCVASSWAPVRYITAQWSLLPCAHHGLLHSSKARSTWRTHP